MNARKPIALHVLVAEDSATQAELLRRSLAQHGHRVTVTRTGAEALAQARAERPSVVITDVVMPGMTGYELCRAIKAEPALAGVPVIVVTSLRALDDVVMALESGADSFLRKPFDTRALLARVHRLTGERPVATDGGAVEITLGTRRHRITASREQILGLLFSSYEEAVHANAELRKRQEEVQALNLELAARAVQLEEANEQLRSFTHTVSHDLRSPLATVNGFSGVLQEKYAAVIDDAGRGLLAGIQDESRRMARIVDDILYLANIDREAVTHSDLDIAALAHDAVAAIRQRHPEHRFEFHCTDTATARGDEKLLRIALANLLGNAVKFSARRQDARVELSIEQEEDGSLLYCVRDNGAGFDMAHAHRLFKPFERLHRADEYAGFGVGLATVHRIVALHGGRIWAEAEPGKGACFRFTLG